MHNSENVIKISGVKTKGFQIMMLEMGLWKQADLD